MEGGKQKENKILYANIDYFLSILARIQQNEKINNLLKDYLREAQTYLKMENFHKTRENLSKIENILKSNTGEFAFTEFFPELHPDLLKEIPEKFKSSLLPNLKNDPAYLTLYYLLNATNHFYLEEYEQAISFFEKTISLARENQIKLTDFETIYYNIASTYRALNKNIEAIKYLDILIEHLGKSEIRKNYKQQLIKIYFERGQLNVILEQNQQATNDFRKIIKIFEKNTLLVKKNFRKIFRDDANHTYKQSIKVTKYFNEIISNLDKLTKMENKELSARIYFAYGQLNIIFGQNQQAKNDFYKAICFDYNVNFHIKCYHKIKKINLLMEDVENTKNNCEKIIQINKTSEVKSNETQNYVKKAQDTLDFLNNLSVRSPSDIKKEKGGVIQTRCRKKRKREEENKNENPNKRQKIMNI